MHAARLACPQHRAGDVRRRPDADAIERELDLQHPAERLRLVEPDLRAGIGTLALLEDQASKTRDRLIARIPCDLDIADGHARRRRLWRGLREGGLCSRHEGNAIQDYGQAAPRAPPLPLVGRGWGWGQRNSAQLAPPNSCRTTPLPNPPPQGGRNHPEFGEGERSEPTNHRRPRP